MEVQYAVYEQQRAQKLYQRLVSASVMNGWIY
jgi:hypothetical protein